MAGEAEDMLWSWGHFYLTYNEKAVDPPGEAKPTSDMWRLLAQGDGLRRSGLQNDGQRACRRIHPVGRPADGRASTWIISRSTASSASTSARRTTALPHKDGKFPTPSGKVELLLHDAKNFVAGPFRAMYDGDQDGTPVDPLPGYVPNREAPETNPERARLYSLNIISPKSHGFLNSCYANEPHKIKGQGEQFVIINPTDAASAARSATAIRCASITTAATSRAWPASPTTHPSASSWPTLGYWRSLNRSDGSVNSISSDEQCGLGRAPTFSDNLVEVARMN